MLPGESLQELNRKHRAQGAEHGAQGTGHGARGSELRARGTGLRAKERLYIEIILVNIPWFF